MIKRLKPSILLLIHLLFLQSILGQEHVSMTDYLSQRFLRYCKSVPREEIFIHCDRDNYISGETLWFNVYLIDRQGFKPSFNSRIVYFELLNTENRPVVQKRILIDRGIGPGQIVLPDTLSSGIYTIRAYTSWMKNFLPDNCFLKDIAVYNALSNTAFKGKLSSGNFTKSRNSKNVLMEIKSTGVTLGVNNSKPDVLEISLRANNKFRSENNDLFYVFIQTHGNINHVSTEKMTEETTKINLPKSVLSSGINQITIFDSKGQPVSQRFIYTARKGNDFISLHSTDTCGVRRKITLEIEPGNGPSSAFDSANLSISIAPDTNDISIMDMEDYLVFGTEYGGLPEKSYIKQRRINELPADVIDSILLNIRSNWIDWAKILSDKVPHFKYKLEAENHLILGKLVTGDDQAVHSEELILMSTPGKEAAFQYAQTDPDGNFSFNLHIDESLKDFILMPDDVSRNHKIIIESSFSDQYLKSENSMDSETGPMPHGISKLSINHQVQKIYGVPATGYALAPVIQPLVPLRFYGEPDIALILADYISLPVMSEIFFELLPGVSMKKKKSGYEISITYHVGDNLFVLSPCLMIDGVIIKDPSMIANLEPEIVEKIDVIKEKYLVGKYVFSGIVNVITKSGGFSCVSLPDYMIRHLYRIVDPVMQFISPDYSSEEMMESHIPDYRNTLYWNPSVNTGKDGKARVEFWSSDNKSNYVINIQGITQGGKMFSLQKIINVK